MADTNQNNMIAEFQKLRSETSKLHKSVVDTSIFDSHRIMLEELREIRAKMAEMTMMKEELGEVRQQLAETIKVNAINEENMKKVAADNAYLLFTCGDLLVKQRIQEVKLREKEVQDKKSMEQIEKLMKEIEELKTELKIQKKENGEMLSKVLAIQIGAKKNRTEMSSIKKDTAEVKIKPTTLMNKRSIVEEIIGNWEEVNSNVNRDYCAIKSYVRNGDQIIERGSRKLNSSRKYESIIDTKLHLRGNRFETSSQLYYIENGNLHIAMDDFCPLVYKRI